MALNYGTIQATLNLTNSDVNPTSLSRGTLYFNTDAGRMELSSDGEGCTVVPLNGDSISNFSSPNDSFDFDGHALTGLADPTNPQDAMTLNYGMNTYLPATTPLNDIALADGDINVGNQKITNVPTSSGPGDAANVQVVLNTVAANSNYGGYSLTTPGSAQAVSDGVYVELSPDGIFGNMPLKSFSVSNNRITASDIASGTFYEVTCIATVQSSVLANECFLNVYVNGSLAGINPSKVELISMTTDVQIVWNGIIELNKNDYISPFATLESDGNLTTTALSLTVSQI